MNTKRKLAAILSADVAGYSRLMAQDEEATVSALNQSRGVFRNAVDTHGGRVIDTAGDSVLAEFVSPVEAVKCATEVQREIARLNARVPEQRRMLFRIGVNLGDVVEQDGTLYGDGVNVAARLQELSDPGGVWIAGTVFDQVEGKLPLVFTSMGEQTVKNIPKPVRAYRVAPEAALAGHASSLAMPTGPVIAVLTFTNMTGDPKEDYFSDELTGSDTVLNVKPWHGERRIERTCPHMPGVTCPGSGLASHARGQVLHCSIPACGPTAKLRKPNGVKSCIDTYPTSTTRSCKTLATSLFWPVLGKPTSSTPSLGLLHYRHGRLQF